MTFTAIPHIAYSERAKYSSALLATLAPVYIGRGFDRRLLHWRPLLLGM